MNQILSKFTPRGKLQDAQPGCSVISPMNSGLRLIVNFVSIKPSFTQPLDLMIDRIWKRVKQDYYGWAGDLRNFKLGSIKDSLCASDIMVVNLLVKNEDGIVDAPALETALQKLTNFAKTEKASLHFSDHLVNEVPGLRDLADKYCATNGVNCYFYPTVVAKVVRRD